MQRINNYLQYFDNNFFIISYVNSFKYFTVFSSSQFANQLKIILLPEYTNTKGLTESIQPLIQLLHVFIKYLYLCIEGHEGLKWEWGLGVFEARKWDLIHWDWELSTQEQWKMGTGLMFFPNQLKYGNFGSGIRKKLESGNGIGTPSSGPSRQDRNKYLSNSYLNHRQLSSIS